jgi:hypothetical protein
MRQFTRDAYLKVFFSNKQATDEGDEEIENLRVNSKWMPTEIPNNIASWVGNFKGAFTRLFCPRNGKSNMTKFQATILQSICENESVIIAHADKNLGPVGVDTNQYIRWALDKHILDTTPYQQVSEDNALQCTPNLYYEIYQWTNNFAIASNVSQSSIDYIRYNTLKNRLDPFGYFCLTIKIHKTPVSTRPVCSDCASIIHPLGKWLDYALQPIVK